MAELRAAIEADQQMLIQFSEEKMALACQCYDLVDMHLMQMERDIDVFEGELQVRAQWGASQLGDFSIVTKETHHASGAQHRHLRGRAAGGV